MSTVVHGCNVRVVQQLREDAYRRFVQDEELERFEAELRGDLKIQGTDLSWDAKLTELQKQSLLPKDLPPVRGYSKSPQPLSSENIIVPAYLLSQVPQGTDHSSSKQEVMLDSNQPLGGAVTDSSHPPEQRDRAMTEEEPNTEHAGCCLLQDFHWEIQSEQPWQLMKEQCTLTILENAMEGMVKFDLRKHRDNSNSEVICTKAKLNELCEQQIGLKGTRRVNAAIAKLIQELQDGSSRNDPTADFGEDDPAMPPSPVPPASQVGQPVSEWQMQAQQPFKIGQEHCTLTILENFAEGLLQFEVVKQSDNSTMYVTCTNEQFDGLVAEQKGLEGTGQTNAAITQLFLEAQEEVNKPLEQSKPVAHEVGDGFGEDHAVLPKPKALAANAHSGADWEIQSQQPWKLGSEHCTLTILENKRESLVQFDMLKHSSHNTMSVAISNVQFDGLVAEQGGLSGTARINAAISQLFQEAQYEVNKPVDGVGEDFGEETFVPPPMKAAASTGSTAAASDWQIQSQQPWNLGKEHCTLTILENSRQGLIQFEMLKQSDHTTMCITCTNAQFDALCAEHTGLVGASQVNAAISQLFREGQDEVSKATDGVNEDFGEEPFVPTPAKQPAAASSDSAVWEIQSQQPWKHGEEHCTLTILENTNERLTQFSLLKHSDHTTMHVTCSNTQFDDLCAEQTGLSGASKVNAAIMQLFKEAQEEMAKPNADSAADYLGEGDSPLPKRQMPSQPATWQWQVQSQQPWQLGRAHCTLTILENSGEGLIQFEMLKHSDNTKMYITCTFAQFDGLTAEQRGLTGAAQTNAAISQLFREAQDEVSKSPDGVGEDFGEDPFVPPPSRVHQAAGANSADWEIQSQQPWQHGADHCTLTILENKAERLVQFQLVKQSDNSTMHVTCTDAQFDALCAEQSGLTGTRQINAAITQLFHEAHAEMGSA